MKAVILAAGIGSRLRPITYEKPKCLTKVYGKSILEKQIENMYQCGIFEVIIVTGYRSEAVFNLNLKERFRKMKLHFIENEYYEMTNNMYSLYLTRFLINNESFILCNGDVFFEASILRQLLSSEREDLIAVDKGIFNNESMKIKTDGSNKIIDISKEIVESDAAGCSIDIYKFSGLSSSILFEEIEKMIEIEKKSKEWTEIALQRLFQTNRINMEPMDIAGAKWVEIDDHKDLAEADRVFSELRIDFKEGILFIDLDGTLFVGGNMIPGADKFIEKLIEEEIQFFLLSNNSSYSKEKLRNKLSSMGITVGIEQIILSTDGLIDYLLYEGISETFVVGSSAMKNMLEQYNIVTESENPEYVLLGYDTEINYDKMKRACHLINKDIPYIATHCDISCPSPNGPIPDIGSFIAMFELVTGKSPTKIFGKPNAEMLTPALKANNISEPSKIYVIGDRLYTDKELAENVQGNFICVLSGETERAQVEELKRFPQLIVNRVADLLPLI